jgi:hypothetical protein
VPKRNPPSCRREAVLVTVYCAPNQIGVIRDIGVRVSADKFDNECFLFGGLDGARTVVGAHPSDRLAARMAVQDRKAGQGGSGAPVSPETTHLHLFPGTSPLEHGSQGGDVGRIIGDTEIRPVQVVVSPRRVPLVIKLEPVVRWLLTDVGSTGSKDTAVTSVPSGNTTTDRCRCTSNRWWVWSGLVHSATSRSRFHCTWHSLQATTERVSTTSSFLQHAEVRQPPAFEGPGQGRHHERE